MHSAFTFPLLGHNALERVVVRPNVHTALDGVAAAVVGLIAATALQLLNATLRNPLQLLIFAIALFTAFRLKSGWSVVIIILGAALLGALLLA